MPADVPVPETSEARVRSDVEMVATLAHGISAGWDGAATLSALAGAAASLVPTARGASVCRGIQGRMIPCAASDDVARDMDAAQRRLSTGPSVTALGSDGPACVSADLEADGRWPGLGSAARARGVRSVLAARLAVDTIGETPYVLTLYTDRAGAFDDVADRERADRCVALIGLAAAAVLSWEKARNLTQALASSREIGVGMGVLMANHRIQRGQAFELLRIASQNENRKLREVAVQVGDTGTLELPQVGTRETSTRTR